MEESFDIDGSDEAPKNDDIRYIERYDTDKSIRFLQRYLVTIKRERVGKKIYENDDYMEYLDVPVRNDFRPFVKLFINNSTARAINKLKQSSMSLLYHIMYQIPLNGNKIRLNSRAACEATGLAMSTYDKAKKQLIKDEWIFRVKDDDPTLFTINLERFAKGSVERIIKEYDIKDLIDKVLRDRLKEQWTQEKAEKWKEEGKEYLEALKKDIRKDIHK
jgi:hypothetical protein